jgi:hypothetical protein
MPTKEPRRLFCQCTAAAAPFTLPAPQPSHAADKPPLPDRITAQAAVASTVNLGFGSVDVDDVSVC